MYRVWAIEERVKKAALKGSTYLLVCYDVFDRMKGDSDLGYYYPTFSTVVEVRTFLDTVQLSHDTRSGAADVCEAVIELSRATDVFDITICEPPEQWLERVNQMN